MRACVLSFALIAALPGAAAAQTTPWGDPDLQGIWSNQTPIPLERPAALANKPFFTKAEAAEVEKNSLATILQIVGGAIPTSGELNGIWLEAAKGKVGRNLRTSQVADPPDGQIPYTKDGKTRWFATPSLEGDLMGRTLATSGPLDRTLDERCITTGGIFVPNPFYNNYHQIVQAPGYVVILTEMMHEQRVVPLDRRPHVGASNQLTVTDPNTFSKPWTVENSLWRSDEGIFEVACHEGNYGLANILSGARAAERK